MSKFLFIRIAIISAVIGLAIAGHAENAPLVVKTKSFPINFQVGADGRLYQQPMGADNKAKQVRDDEFYPQAGDGYVWEPALEVIHADGNTSTALVYDGMTKTNESPDIETT